MTSTPINSKILNLINKKEFIDLAKQAIYKPEGCTENAHNLKTKATIVIYEDLLQKHQKNDAMINYIFLILTRKIDNVYLYSYIDNICIFKDTTSEDNLAFIDYMNYLNGLDNSDHLPFTFNITKRKDVVLTIDKLEAKQEKFNKVYYKLNASGSIDFTNQIINITPTNIKTNIKSTFEELLLLFKPFLETSKEIKEEIVNLDTKYLNNFEKLLCSDGIKQKIEEIPATLISYIRPVQGYKLQRLNELIDDKQKDLANLYKQQSTLLFVKAYLDSETYNSKLNLLKKLIYTSFEQNEITNIEFTKSYAAKNIDIYFNWQELIYFDLNHLRKCYKFIINQYYRDYNNKELERNEHIKYMEHVINDGYKLYVSPSYIRISINTDSIKMEINTLFNKNGNDHVKRQCLGNFELSIEKASQEFDMFKMYQLLVQFNKSATIGDLAGDTTIRCAVITDPEGYVCFNYRYDINDNKKLREKRIHIKDYTNEN